MSFSKPLMRKMLLCFQTLLPVSSKIILWNNFTIKHCHSIVQTYSIHSQSQECYTSTWENSNAVLRHLRKCKISNRVLGYQEIILKYVCIITHVVLSTRDIHVCLKKDLYTLRKIIVIAGDNLPNSTTVEVMRCSLGHQLSQLAPCGASL